MSAEKKKRGNFSLIMFHFAICLHSYHNGIERMAGGRWKKSTMNLPDCFE
jgi:hypothetical protein